MNTGSPSTPSSPYTLSNERYKANVNRTKTRKWVEAKKIDYGGDDWGAEDDFEEDEAEADVPAANERSQTFPQQYTQPSRTDRLAGLRAIGDGSGSSTPRSGSAGSARSMRPSERIAMERQASGGVQQQRNYTAPPALHLNTGVQVQQPVQSGVEPQESSTSAQQSPYPPRKSSMDQQDRPNLTVEQRTSSGSASPGMRSPPSGTGSVMPRSSGSGDADTANVQRRPSFGRNDTDGSRTTQPLASVAERRSEYGFDGLMINSGAAPAPQPTIPSDNATKTARDPGTTQDPATSLSSEPAAPTLQYPQSSDDRHAAVQQPPKRYSISPKLPDFSRISGFGSDFFSSGGGFLGGSPKQPEAPAEATHMPAAGSTLEPGSPGVTATADSTRHVRDQPTAAQIDDQAAATSNSQYPAGPRQPKPLRPSLPGTWVSETPSSVGEMATPYSEQGDRAIDPRITTIGEHPDDDFLKPAPLRTPTPRDRDSFSRLGDDDRSSNRSGRSSPTKVQPLRTTTSRLSNVEQSDQKPTQKHDADASSEAQQASDVTPGAPAPLQPRKSAGDLAPEERQRITRTDTMLTDASSPMKESDVLRDEIIRSLSPVRGSDSHLNTQDDAGAARESAYLSDVYGDYWAGGDKRTDDEQRDVGHPGALTSVKEGGSASGTPTPPTASELDPEHVKPNVRRERFSWEAGSSTVPSPTKKHPLPQLPGDEPGPSTEAHQLASPVDLGRMSPTIALPVIDFDRNDEDTTLKDDHSPAGLFTSNALVPADDENSARRLSGDHETTTSINRDSDLFSATTEKMNFDSPTSPDAHNPYYTALGSEPMRSESPTDVPLPHSPTEAADGAADMTPPTSSNAQNTMNLKQIMALPTSPERVYKLHEARAEFAATPSGLSQWINQLLAQPEHANAGFQFGYAPAGEDLPLFANSRRNNAHNAAVAAVGGDAVVSGAGRRSSLQLGGPGGGTGGTVRIGAQAGQQLGNLMHGPAGAKGKELLQSAGKMGKGLLSKGKSKLRERAESKKG